MTPVLAWLRHHWLELVVATALAIPTIISPWLAVLPCAWLAWWAGHEYRIHRRTPTPPPRTTNTTAHDDTHTDDDRSEASA